MQLQETLLQLRNSVTLSIIVLQVYMFTENVQQQ